jgi:uncharacterized membrane protein YccC
MIYGWLLRLLPIGLGVVGWYSSRWFGMFVGVFAGCILAVAVWVSVLYISLSVRMTRRMREVEAMASERLTEVAADPTSRDLGFAIGELEKRGIKTRPSLASVCELLMSPDSNRRGLGMSLMFGFYPKVWAQIAEDSSSDDPPDVWRKRLAALRNEG